MVSVLYAAGYGPAESLELFLVRFPLQTVSTKLDEDLERVWVCHKSKKNISRLEAAMYENNVDVENHKRHVRSASELNIKAAENLQDCFDPSAIIHKIFASLHCCLANYVLTECLVLYNWGVNALELVVENKDFLRDLLDAQTKPPRNRRPLEDYHHKFRAWRRILAKKRIGARGKKVEEGGHGDLFAEEEAKLNRMKMRENRRQAKKRRNIQKVIRAYREFERPLPELRRNQSDPLQKVVSLDKALFDGNERKWPRNNALSLATAEEFLASALNREGEEAASRSGSHLKRIVRSMMNNHEKLNRFDGYGRLLKHYLKKGGLGDDCRKRDLRPIPLSLVIAYVLDVLRKFLPMEFFGCNRGRKRFFREVVRLLKSYKHERFLLRHFAEAFTSLAVPPSWYLDLSEGARNAVASGITKWILLDYVCIVVRNNFYVTDVGSSGNALFYYRKCDVTRITDLWLNARASDGALRRVEGKLDHWNSAERTWLETGAVEARDAATRIFMPKSTEFVAPVARVRLIPKAITGNGVRIISNVAAKETSVRARDREKRKFFGTFMARAVKRGIVLKHVKLMLEYLVEKYGTGIEPLPQSIHLRAAWNKAVNLKATSGKLYFVKADVSDAFGSVELSLLCDIIDRMLRKRCDRVLQLKRIGECRVRRGRVEHGTRKSFGCRPRENALLVSRSVFVGTKRRLRSYRAKSLKKILDTLVLNQYIASHGKTYRLTRGLLQGGGGTLSCLLCEIYYSEMDRTAFREFADVRDCVFLRGVDDYLLLTSNAEKARKFHGIAVDGVKAFNAFFSSDKLRSNACGSEESLVRYLGLVFDVNAATVHADYSRFEKKELLAGMTLSSDSALFRKFRFIRRRAFVMSALKLYPVLLSPCNGVSAVRGVVFGACLLQANRLLALAVHFLREGEKNELELCMILSESLRRILNIVRRQNREISRDEVIWLFWRSVVITFERRHASSGILAVARYMACRIRSKMEKSGRELLLRFLAKDAKEGPAWTDSEKVFRLITEMTKPLYRLKDGRH